MSLEQSIADLIEQAGLLLDLPQEVADAGTAKITALQAAYASLLASGTVSAYIDQENGSDTNEGTIGSPYKTITKALSLTPRGGRCICYMMNDYYVSGADINVDGRILQIKSSTTIKHAFTFQAYSFGSGITYRSMYGFALGDGGKILFDTIRLEMPELGGLSVHTAANSGMFKGRGMDRDNLISLGFRTCELVFPATPVLPMVFDGNLVQLRVSGVSYPGALTDPKGWLFGAQPNTAGVQSYTLSWLQTNLEIV